MSARVGQDIEAVCGKCGDTWHVVVACVGNTIAKVICKQCGNQHRYRSGAPIERRTRASAARVPTTARPKSTSPLIAADLSRPVRSYNIAERFIPGDRITHKSFGEGLVELTIGPGKIQVFFPGGRRVLVHEQPMPH